jgi:hypothetical protein
MEGGRRLWNILKGGASYKSLGTSGLVYKTTGRIMVLYILTFTTLDSKREDKRLWTKWQQAFPEFNLFVPSILNC